MQALLNEKETKLWEEGKTEADVMREKLKESKRETELLTRTRERMQDAVKAVHGCHHDGTRDSCDGCILYENEETHDRDTGWLMCASYRKSSKVPAAEEPSTFVDHTVKCPKCGAGTFSDDSGRFCSNIGGWVEGPVGDYKDGCGWRES